MLPKALLSTACLTALAAALPSKTDIIATQPDDCKEVTIPVTVEVPRFLISTEIRDDWDAAALTFNLTRRDFGQATFPLPITGTTSAPVKSTYEVGATLCGNGSTTLILTHGILESKLYWQPDFPDSERYDFVKAAVKAGYSVLSYDRIGVRSSSRINSIMDAQFQVQVAVLNSLIEHVRTNSTARKVALVGHSYGAYISIAAAAAAASSIQSHSSTSGVDAVILTGFAGGFSHFAPFLAGAGLRVAREQNPERWGALDPGYLTTVDEFADTYIYYHAGDFARRVAAWTHARGSEPTTSRPAGGNCEGQLGEIRGNLTGPAVVETVDDLPAGFFSTLLTNVEITRHNLNLHFVAPRAFELIFDFLKRQGL
ncbi:hypothetical protein PG995_012242 [Apiospora arundinis]